MTCVDYSVGMLDSFAKKNKNKKYAVELIRMDVTKLHLRKKFGLILLPSQSFSEILSVDLQRMALKSISLHLDRDGIFILTLNNPVIRLRTADGMMRVFGEFPIEEGKKLVFSYVNKYDPSDKIVSGYQFYEIYDSSNRMIEKRFLEINFKLISDQECCDMIKDMGFEILERYGDYSYAKYDEKTSNYLIYKLIKK
jgi:hypothetical protein